MSDNSSAFDPYFVSLVTMAPLYVNGGSEYWNNGE